MNERDKLAKILERFSDTFAIKSMFSRFVPDTPVRVMEQIVNNAPSYGIRYDINLEEYVQIYDLGLRVPSEVEITIGYLKNKEYYGYGFALTYHKAKSALLHCNIEQYKDKALREALTTARAAIETTPDPETIASPSSHFDMDRE